MYIKRNPNFGGDINPCMKLPGKRFTNSVKFCVGFTFKIRDIQPTLSSVPLISYFSSWCHIILEEVVVVCFFIP